MRVTFEEGLTVFAEPLARIFDDADHSEDERRELIVGHSNERRLPVRSNVPTIFAAATQMWPSGV